MKILSVLFLFFFSAVASAQGFFSYLSNGSSIALHVLRLRSNLTVESRISKTLDTPGGLTSIRPSTQPNQFYVYYNRRPVANGPTKIYRETVSTQPFQFVAGSTKVFTINTNSLLNLDIDGALSTMQRVAGRVDTRRVDASGNFVGPFRRSPALPGTPYSTRALEPPAVQLASTKQDFDLVTILSSNQQTGQEFLTFWNLNTNTQRSVGFSGSATPFVHDTETLPNGNIVYGETTVTDATPRDLVGTNFRVFTPVLDSLGNVRVADTPKPHGNIPLISFNTLCIGTLPNNNIVFFMDRFNIAANTNFFVLRTFNGVTLDANSGVRPLTQVEPGNSQYGCGWIDCPDGVNCTLGQP